MIRVLRRYRAHTSSMALACLLAMATLVASSAARADDVWTFLSARAEGGVGGMLGDYQITALQQQLGVEGALRLGVRPFRPLVIEASYETWYLPSSAGAGYVHLLGGGLRLEPRVGDVGWLCLDANVGVALTGSLTRFGLSVGAGFEFSIGGVVGLGPMLRYGQIFATAADHPSDAMFLSGGVSITLRGAERDEPPPVREIAPVGDRDGDSFDDAHDLCPDLAASDAPDSQRAGCPLVDTDGDGVSDRDDGCSTVPAGVTPDPQRSGCPASDSDADGALDHVDGCPTTPQGPTPDPARLGCPDADSDSDRITNSADRCPAEHAGLHPDPDRPGCPLADRDHDSVIDRDDACPDEAGAPHPSPRRNGCPGLVRVDEGRIEILRPVFFATGSDRILSRSRGVLQAITDALDATPQIRRVSIEGHTDDVGEEEGNLELSTRRAQSVMAWLIQHGVVPARLEAHGFGESRPLIAAPTEQARGVNRRVEMRIVDPPVEAGAARSTTSGDTP